MVTAEVPHVGGPIVTGEATVLVGYMPAARVTDTAVCVGPPDVIVKGAPTVLIGYKPAARVGDQTAHGGVIVAGCPTVLIGERGSGGFGGANTPCGAAALQAKTARAAMRRKVSEETGIPEKALEVRLAPDGSIRNLTIDGSALDGPVQLKEGAKIDADVIVVKGNVRNVPLGKPILLDN
jgi:uncharacterized Zn-binding protein involved in type VI secretion